VHELPRGTVTFLFTDIEGSTRLLHELGPARYADALAEHRRVVREAATAHGGVEVDTQGDAFFIAFPTPGGAAAAAQAACAGLGAGAVRRGFAGLRAGPAGAHDRRPGGNRQDALLDRARAAARRRCRGRDGLRPARAASGRRIPPARGGRPARRYVAGSGGDR